MSAVLQAGAARRVITPAVGACLYGYRPDWKSESVHDELHVTALALRQNGQRALLLTIEVGDMHTSLCDETRAVIARETDVPVQHILLCCTHTHSAPNVSGMEGWGEIDRPYFDDILLPAAADAAKEAVGTLRDATVAVGTTKSLVGVNRRQIYADGHIGLGQNPFGCFDPEMTCVSFRETDGRGILNLLHYGCHGTAAGLNREITRDWSGIMIDRVEHESGTLTAFWNGAVGDVGPRLTNGETTGNICFVEELGGVAAADGVRAWKACGGAHTETLRVLCGTVKLPYRALPTLAEVKQKLAELGDEGERINLDRLTYDHYKQLETLLESGQTAHPTHFSFPVCMVQVGGVLFVPFPYEIFSEITLRLRTYLPVRHVLCLSCVNGYNGYFPSQDQICRGGYEVDVFCAGSVYTLTDDADQYLIEEILRIRKENP